MSKYDPFGAYLRNQPADQVPMTFAEIERVLGVRLPNSAYEHRPWWSNNATNSVLTKVWLDAGFRSTRVDMANRKLVFERTRNERGVAEDSKTIAQTESMTSPTGQNIGRHPLIGALKGTFTIEIGYDLTKPAMTEWADSLDEKYGPETRK